jgi:phage tail-like protein
MASIINNRSSLTTDPIRNFRFLVTFKPINGSNVTNPLGTNTGATAPGTQPVGTSPVTNPSAANATFGFTSVSGLSVTTDSIPYREGGYNTTVHQIPGQTTFSPIQLQRGVTLGTDANWNWMKQLFQVVEGSSSTSVAGNQFRCDVEIQVLSHPIGDAASGDTNKSANGDHIAMRFNVYNAWITSVAYSDLNAGDNALFVEQMTLVHEGFDLKWATDLNASALPF